MTDEPIANAPEICQPHGVLCIDVAGCHREGACLRGDTPPVDGPELTRDELLALLAEECAEVIVAISKARRFGFATMWPGYGRNDYAIAREVGDVLGVLDALNVFSWNEGESVLPQSPLMNARRNKIEKARAMKRVALDRLRALSGNVDG